MKQFRTTFILLSILLVLLLVVVFFASDTADKKRNESLTDRPVLKERQINQVDQVVFDALNSDPFTLQKSDNVWTINGVRLDQDEQERFLSALKSFPNGKIISKSRSNWDKYGLAEESSSVVTLTSDGNEVSKFYIGSVGPSYQSVYVRRGDDESVYLVNTELDDLLQYDSNRWKNKQLIVADKDDLQSFTVRIGEERWSFEKQTRKWGWMVDGTWTEVEDLESFEMYLDGLLSLKADAIETDATLYTSSDSAVAFVLEGGKEHIVSLDVVDDTQTFVLITDQPDVLKFSSNLNQRLQPEFLKVPEVPLETTDETSPSTQTIVE
jgi:hypothetical protein